MPPIKRELRAPPLEPRSPSSHPDIHTEKAKAESIVKGFFPSLAKPKSCLKQPPRHLSESASSSSSSSSSHESDKTVSFQVGGKILFPYLKIKIPGEPEVSDRHHRRSLPAKPASPMPSEQPPFFSPLHHSTRDREQRHFPATPEPTPAIGRQIPGTDLIEF